MARSMSPRSECNAPLQAFHSIARRERRSDTDGFTNTRNGQIGPPAHVEAAAQLSENHGPAVARRLTDPGEGGENDRRVPLQLAIVACLHFQRGPLFAVRGGSSLFVDDVREDAVVLPDFRAPRGRDFCATASASSASCRASTRRPGWFCSKSARLFRRCPSSVGFRSGDRPRAPSDTTLPPSPACQPPERGQPAGSRFGRLRSGGHAPR